MAAARSLAASLGAARLLVSVVHANENALRFYRREGFAPFYVTLLESRDLLPPRGEPGDEPEQA